MPRYSVAERPAGLSVFQWLPLAALLLLASACADYDSGYQQGYNNIAARQWLVLGREEYQRAYEEGRMQAFQDEWYAENAADIVAGLSCPPILVQSSRLLFIDE